MKQSLAIALVGLFMTAGAMAAEPAQNAAQTPPPGYGRSMSFSSTKIVVADLDKAMRFYAGTLGMKEAARYSRPDLQEIMLNFPGEQIPQLVLVYYPDNRKIELGNAYGYLVFVTPDIKGLVAKIKANGYEVVREPSAMGDLKISVAFAKDHEGRPIELVELAQK